MAKVEGKIKEKTMCWVSITPNFSQLTQQMYKIRVIKNRRKKKLNSHSFYLPNKEIQSGKIQNNFLPITNAQNFRKDCSFALRENCDWNCTRSIFIQKYFLLFLKSLSHISHLDMQATKGPLKGFFIYLGIATTCWSTLGTRKRSFR